MNQSTSPCTPPADPGSAAVVAHASESSGGACIPPTLEQFQRWLEDRAHEASHAFDKPPAKGDSREAHQWRCYKLVSSCRAATSLLMHFKLEHLS